MEEGQELGGTIAVEGQLGGHSNVEGKKPKKPLPRQ